MDGAALVAQGRLAILAQQERPVEIDIGGVMREQHRRGHGERRADHAADHDLEAARPSLVHELQRLGEAAGLVELDVDRVVTPGQGVEPGTVVQALVGADRNRAVDRGQEFVLTRRQGLLDQVDAGRRAGHEVVADRLRPPRLVGIDDETGFGRASAHRGDPLGIALAAELHL